MALNEVELIVLNDILERGIETIQNSKDSRKINTAISKINTTLTSAIFDHPESINAVVITADVDLNAEVPGYLRSDRYSLKEYLKLAFEKDTLPDKLEFKFVQHLPYSSRKIPHNHTRNYSFETISLNAGVMVSDSAFIVLNHTGSPNMISDYKSCLLSEEISSIELAQVDDIDFSPIYSLEKGKGIHHLARSAAKHYASYRKFWYHDVGEINPEHKYADVLNIAKDVSIPHTWEGFENKSTWGGWFKRDRRKITGLAFYSGGNSEMSEVLYEFDGFTTPKDLKSAENNVLAAYAIAMNQETQQENIKIYTGKDIIPHINDYLNI